MVLAELHVIRFAAQYPTWGAGIIEAQSHGSYREMAFIKCGFDTTYLPATPLTANG